jgi:predicted regulator of Ras-like GTPase activity (Roadblock/LC7/MglB family)
LTNEDEPWALCLPRLKHYGRLNRINQTKGIFPVQSTRTDLMVERLRTLRANTPDVESSAVVSVDGLIIASSLPSGIEEDRVSAMSAAMLSLGERISGELGRGTLDEVYIHGDQGYVLLVSIGSDAVLTVQAREKAKLGLVFLEMRRASKDLEALVG